MDPHRLSASVCVLTACLLGTTRLSSVGHCACPEIPIRKLTLQPEPGNCFNVNYTYRYTCIPGFVRKAGTSNLIKCSSHSQWTTTKFPLECIPHPDSTPPLTTHIPDGSSITTAALNQPGTSTSHPSGRSSATETTSSANMEQSTSETKSTTTVVSYKTWSSTYSPSSHSNGSSSMKETSTETSTAADTTTIGVASSVVILLVCMSGVLFILYRRRKRPIPPQETEEMQPMNNPS